MHRKLHWKPKWLTIWPIIAPTDAVVKASAWWDIVNAIQALEATIAVKVRLCAECPLFSHTYACRSVLGGDNCSQPIKGRGKSLGPTPTVLKTRLQSLYLLWLHVHVLPLPLGVCPVLCSQRGEYINGECQCNPGWKGKECQLRHDECEVPDCNGHGHCANGKCNCIRGYKGKFCEEGKHFAPSHMSLTH